MLCSLIMQDFTSTKKLISVYCGQKKGGFICLVRKEMLEGMS